MSYELVNLAGTVLSGASTGSLAEYEYGFVDAAFCLVDEAAGSGSGAAVVGATA